MMASRFTDLDADLLDLDGHLLEDHAVNLHLDEPAAMAKVHQADQKYDIVSRNCSMPYKIKSKNHDAESLQIISRTCIQKVLVRLRGS